MCLFYFVCVASLHMFWIGSGAEIAKQAFLYSEMEMK